LGLRKVKKEGVAVIKFGVKIGQEYIPLVDWFSLESFGFERSMYIDKRS